MPPTPDRYAPYTITLPERLRAAAFRLAESRCSSFSGLLADLLRAALDAAGEPVPEPPPVRRNGPAPRKTAAKRGAPKKSARGA